MICIIVLARQVQFGTYRHEGTSPEDGGMDSEKDSENLEKEHKCREPQDYRPPLI